MNIYIIVKRKNGEIELYFVYLLYMKNKDLFYHDVRKKTNPFRKILKKIASYRKEFFD